MEIVWMLELQTFLIFLIGIETCLYPQDIESIDALAEAIGEYDGGVIIVS